MRNEDPRCQSRYALVTLGLVFMECTASLEQRLVDTATTGDDPDGRARTTSNGLLRTAGQTDAGLVLLGRVTNDGRVVARRARERTAVTDLLLDVADDGTFWARRDGEDVADGEGRLLAAVDECAGVHALGRDEGLLAELVAVGIAEDDAGEGSTAAGRGKRGEGRDVGMEVRGGGAGVDTHRPESWMISFTMPRTYPLRSAKSSARSWAGFLLRWVCALNCGCAAHGVLFREPQDGECVGRNVRWRASAFVP